MVLVERRQSAVQPGKLHPDAARIAGITGAIALNIAVFAALMSPARIQLAAPASDLIMVTLPTQQKQPDPPPPKVVEVTRQRTAPTAPVTRPITPPTQTHINVPDTSSDVVVVESTLPDLASSHPDTNETGSAAASIPAGPVTGIQLAYASAPPPPYPAALVRAQVQGTVLLKILVDIDGKPLDVSVARSSGDKRLDRAAVEHVRKRWMFHPALRDGQAVQAIGMVPIDFKLQ